MFRLIATLNNQKFAVHNTQSNELKVFDYDPSDFIHFSGMEEYYRSKECKISEDFSSFLEEYQKEIIDKTSAKNAFVSIIEKVLAKGTPLFRDSYYVLGIDKDRSIEIILWKNGVTSLIETDLSFVRNNRVDLDEKGQLGFYTDEKQEWLLALEKEISTIE